jgi:CIC family chloride channel protein
MLALLAALGGVATGAIVSAFRLALDQADALGARLTGLAEPALGPLPHMVLSAVLVAAAVWLVRTFSPQSAGSGIPHVEATVEGKMPAAGLRLLVVKFVGGTFAMSGGLALGREGPSVQMGASLAHLISRAARRNWGDERILIASCAGAGLAAAFNAPIAGAVFVLEELVRRFEARIAIPALVASGTAIGTMHRILGSAPDLPATATITNSMPGNTLFFVFGLAAGVVAVVYSRLLIATLNNVGRMQTPPVLRGLVFGATVGLIAWSFPGVTGPGLNLAQRALDGVEPLHLLPLLLLFRLVFSVMSYAVGTPGGIFAPMLVIGAEFGLLFGLLAEIILPLGVDPRALAVAGMAAIFSAVVRAPVTGIIIVVEMTALPGLMLQSMLAAAGAMVVATMAGVPPIYEDLRRRIGA